MNTPSRHFLFLAASARPQAQPEGAMGNTEWLARQGSQALPEGTLRTWLHLAHMQLPPFVDQRHTVGQYPMPDGDLRQLLDATLDATDVVLVAPVYWFSLPTSIKQYLDHWSAFLRVPGLPFKDAMARKTLWLVSTSGDRTKAQPMIDGVHLCAQFLGMNWGGAFWGKGGPPGAVQADTAALASLQEAFGKVKNNSIE